MTSPYKDPDYQPPADIQGADARAYEEKILELMRDAMLPDNGPVIRLESIELRGDRPDTEVIFIYTDTREPGQRFAKRTWLWKDPFRWPLNDDPRFAGRLNEAYDVAAHVGGAFSAHESDSIELPNSNELRS